jgi:hypothetical protein
MNTKQILDTISSRRGNNSNFILSTDGSTGSSWQSGSIMAVNSWSPEPIRKVSVISKVKLFGIRLWNKTTEISVDEFFTRIGRSKKELKIIDGIVDKYLKRIEKAEKMGQTALVEKMKDDIEVVKREALACLCGIKEYLTNSQIDKLLSKSSKNIELTFIKNFVRHIPDTLLDLKEKLDKEKVFDDYVIAHYDPKKENTALTKKEVERKKDPILFGVIRGSDNFYFIGDWKDEYCNLTLKEAVAVIEEDTKKIN